MRIDVLCHDGSPLGICEGDINGEVDKRIGVGGAELALLTMCAAWKFHGHDIRLFNDPKMGYRSTFEQLPCGAFDPQADRDVLVVFRSPNEKVYGGAKGLKVWWSCDQYTIGDFRDFAPHVDRIVTISPYHTKYFKDIYGIENAQYIDLPVRTWEYKEPPVKKPRQCMFTSIPDRGVVPLRKAWQIISAKVPDATLVITSDWRLWTEWQTEQAIRHYRLCYADAANVSYLGAIKRPELVKIQMASDLLIFPCTYEELFCIAAAEAQVAGALPITSEAGALATTNMGIKLHGNPNDDEFIERFADVVIQKLLSPEKLKEEQCWLRERAMERFSIETILNKWYEVFNA